MLVLAPRLMFNLFFFLSLFQAAQMTHVLEGRLKVAMEGADKELATMEQRATTAERTQDLAEQKANVLQGKLKETETKLAHVKSIVLGPVIRSLLT